MKWAWARRSRRASSCASSGLDAPDARIAVVAPDALTRQWREELDGRFGLDDAELFEHSALVKDKDLLDEPWTCSSSTKRTARWRCTG